MMQRKLNKIAKDTNLFLKRFIAKQKKSNLMVAMKYGLFSGGGDFQKWILISLSILIIIFLLSLIRNESTILSKLSISFIIGGALGNVLDRFTYGAVVDFISLHARGFSWYILNIADIIIVLGVILFILSQFILSKKNVGN